MTQMRIKLIDSRREIQKYVFQILQSYADCHWRMLPRQQPKIVSQMSQFYSMSYYVAINGNVEYLEIIARMMAQIQKYELKNEPRIILIYGTKYSRMDQVKFFKCCLSQSSFGPFLNTLSHMKFKNCLIPDYFRSQTSYKNFKGCYKSQTTLYYFFPTYKAM